jgi:hypothetical protein
MLTLAWKDKRTVSVLSIWHSAQTQPYVPRGRESEPISKPTVICDYTAKMGGVDIADHYTSTYSFGQKSKKWWLKLFFWKSVRTCCTSLRLKVTSFWTASSLEMRHGVTNTSRNPKDSPWSGDIRIPQEKRS